MASSSIVNDFISIVQRPGGGEFLGIVVLAVLATLIFLRFAIELAIGEWRLRRVRRASRAELTRPTVVNLEARRRRQLEAGIYSKGGR